MDVMSYVKKGSISHILIVLFLSGEHEYLKWLMSTGM